MRRESPIRVLIADDSETIRSVMASVLGREDDLEVVGLAADGQAAVELVQRLDVDVAIVDVRIPGLNGLEVTRQIYRARPDVAVIGYSFYEPDEIAGAMRQAGAQAYVSKNESFSVLLAAIRETQNLRSREPG